MQTAKTVINASNATSAHVCGLKCTNDYTRHAQVWLKEAADHLVSLTRSCKHSATRPRSIIDPACTTHATAVEMQY